MFKNDFPTYWLTIIILFLILAGNVFAQVDPNDADINNDNCINIIDFALFVQAYQAARGPLPQSNPNELSILKMALEIKDMENQALRDELAAARSNLHDVYQFNQQLARKFTTIVMSESQRLIDATRPTEINWFSPDRLEVVVHRGASTVGIFFDPNGVR